MTRPAVVLGLLWAGLALARALGRAGISVTGVAFDRREFGLRSRYLRRRVVAADPDAVLAAIRAAGGGGRVVLFPERDAHVEFVLRNWDAVHEVADVPLPDDPDVVWRLRRKERVALEAERAGVATPRTAAAESEEAIRALPFRPPLLVKPVEGQEFAAAFGRKLLVAEGVEEAVHCWRAARGRGFETVVQELVPDAHDKVFSLFTYIGRDGEPLASVVGRKRRAGPPAFGTAAVFELGPEPRVLETGLRLLRSAGYRGFAQVELAYDARDDTFKLLEVNTRPPQWGGIAMTRRFDLARIAYDDLCGLPVEPAPTFDEPGVRWIYLAKDAWSALELARRRAIGPSEFAAPYLGPGKVRAILAADDPLPALASLAYLRAKVL
jgi:predicted ATP-grasp superfamily ATP-dependent carboligase